MSENVIPMFGHIMHDEPPEKIREHAAKWNMTKCLVLGVTETDELVFGGSRFADTDEAVQMARTALQKAGINGEHMKGRGHE